MMTAPHSWTKVVIRATIGLPKAELTISWFCSGKQPTTKHYTLLTTLDYTKDCIAMIIPKGDTIIKAGVVGDAAL